VGSGARESVRRRCHSICFKCSLRKRLAFAALYSNMHRSLFSASRTCITVSQSCLSVLQWSTPPLPFPLNHLLSTSLWLYLGSNNSSAKRVSTSTPILYLTPACLSVCLHGSLPAHLPHLAPQSPLTRKNISGTHAHRQGCNPGTLYVSWQIVDAIPYPS
jgi:hypothetical protein